jgi:Family of unknown function (DUF5996)
MVAQMVGKVRLSLAPPQPEWLNTGLHLDGRGFTMGAMPFGTAAVTIGIDVYANAICIQVSDGRCATVPLGPNRSVADIWADFRSALADLGIEVDMWEPGARGRLLPPGVATIARGRSGTGQTTSPV